MLRTLHTIDESFKDLASIPDLTGQFRGIQFCEDDGPCGDLKCTTARPAWSTRKKQHARNVKKASIQRPVSGSINNPIIVDDYDLVEKNDLDARPMKKISAERTET